MARIKKKPLRNRRPTPIDDEDEVVHGEIVITDDGFDVQNPVHISPMMSAKEKQRQALALRLAGASYQSIADNLGYANKSGAFAACKAAMEGYVEGGATDLRNLLFARLEHIILLNWPAVNQKDGQATAIVLQAMDRITRLFGIEGLPMTEEAIDGVLKIGGNKDNYIEGLRRARNEQKAIGP